MTQRGCAQACSGVTLRNIRGGRAQERPARRGEQHAPHAGGATAAHALKDRVVLAVDRNQRRAALAHRLHEQRAGHDQRFLVRQQDALAGARGGEAGAQAGSADDRGHDRVDLRVRRDLAQRLLARRAPRSANLRCAIARPGAPPLSCQRRRRIAADAAGIARAGARRCCARRARTPRSGRGWRSSTSSVLSPMLPVEPSTATRMRRAHRSSPRRSRPTRKTGAAAVTLSTRSSTPPWPGNRRAAVLQAGVTLEQALGEIADDRGHDDDDAQARESAVHPPRTTTRRAPPSARQRAKPPNTPSQVLPGLTRGASLLRPNCAAGEIRADVRRHDQQQQEQQQLRPVPVQAHQRQPRRHQHQQPGARGRRAIDACRCDGDPEQRE